jgi:hypothetical protein
MPLKHSAAGLTGRRRDLYFLTNPRVWPAWPYLPLVRRLPDGEQELGFLFDAWSANRVTGYSATVFLCNFFQISSKLDEFLALPKEVFDTPEEIVDAWSVD